MLKAKIEAVLFLTDKPMKAQVIARTLNEDVQVVRQGILELIHDYEERKSGLEIADDNGYIIQVKDEYSSLINEFAPLEVPLGLLRTLSAIAIKQPVQQSEIVKIRGAGAYDHIKELMVRELIIKKEADEGRSPLLSTTKKFQEYFRLSGDGKTLRTELHTKNKKSSDKLEADIAALDGDAVQLQLEQPLTAVEAAVAALSDEMDFSIEGTAADAGGVPAETFAEATDVSAETVVAEATNAPTGIAVTEATDTPTGTVVAKATDAPPETIVVEPIQVHAETDVAGAGPGPVERVSGSVDDDESEAVGPKSVGRKQLEDIFDASPDNSLVFKPNKKSKRAVTESEDDDAVVPAPASESTAN